MIKELKLSNFRLFDDEVRVRFRPITVLIGQNNSGKSSIIKFLLMLQQSLDQDSSRFLNPEGSKVSFGNFDALKNVLSGQTDLEFEITTGEESPPYHITNYLKNRNITDIDFDKLRYQAKAKLSYIPQREISDYRATLLYDNKNILEYSDPDASYEKTQFLNFEEQFQKLLEEKDPDVMANKSLVQTLRSNIKDIYHLLPVRNIGENAIITKDIPADNVGQTGKYTLHHLQNIISDKDSYEFILPHLENVASVQKIEFEEIGASISKCLAQNKITKANVLLGDFGFGVSQCLPIFVQGVLMSSYTYLMVEQPEAQLHPTAQLELGSFFADLWNKRRVGSIIETHSDNLLMRFRRLIARGDLSKDDVSVVYFHTEAGVPKIKNLNINEDGSLEPGLPLQFFGGNLEEVLNIGIRQ